VPVDRSTRANPTSGEDGTAPPDRCRLCGEAGRFARYQLREMLFGTRESFEYVRCPVCGVLQIVTIPVDLARHYPPDYYGPAALVPEAPRSGRLRSMARRGRDHAALFGRSALERNVAARLRGPREDGWVRSFVRRTELQSFRDPILDVGCGRMPGALASLQAVGFRNLRGIDPFLEEDGVWRGIPLARSSIHECVGDYQLVMMHHSFEHMPDPVEVMASARRLLRPNGAVLLRTPVMGTWFWDHYGAHWWELDAPRHLFVHSVESLRRCADAAGLELFDVVWDSSFEEMIASEQIARDVAWREPASWSVTPPAGFSDGTIESYRDWVAALNGSGNAGRAGFYFRPGVTIGSDSKSRTSV